MCTDKKIFEGKLKCEHLDSNSKQNVVFSISYNVLNHFQNYLNHYLYLNSWRTFRHIEFLKKTKVRRKP
jgi:hypothetical protein